jgi:cell division protein DivIC
MNRIKQIFRALFQIIKWPFLNFYTGVSTAFLVWVIFIDSNDLATIIKNNWKLREVENEISFFEEKVAEVIEDKNELEGNSRLQEQFAREKFFMKKADEEIFLVVPTKD